MTPVRAWIVIAAFVLTYNILSKPGHTLSEQMDVWITKHPVLVRLGIVTLALHVANLVPRRIDAVHYMFTILGRRT